MDFARKVWSLLVAIKDGLALIVLLAFFALLYFVLTVRPNPGMIHEGALLLKLDGSVVEEPSLVSPLDYLLSSRVPPTEYAARDLVRAIQAAAVDGRAKAVVLDLSNFRGGGQVSLTEIGNALDRVRKAGKPVLTYAVAYDDDAMLLAAHSTEVWVHPMGGAYVIGPGGTNLYFGGLLDRLKVNVHVYKVGTYKSAVEPYIRNDQSEPAREAGQALVGALWQNWQDDFAKARPKANLPLVTKDTVGWLKSAGGDTAKAAQNAGLVDRVGDRVEFGKRVAELAGANAYDPRPGSFAHSTLKAWLAGHELPSEGKTVGVVTIAGEIVDGRQGPGVAGGERIVKLLDDALAEDISALVVRVDSPGGSVMASEDIRRAILRHKAKGIPVVVSMANYAASGGYWVSTPAERIFAEPSTITGSIGVFAVVPSFEKALGQYGVTGDGPRATSLSAQPDLIRGFTPEIDSVFQQTVESNYARFLSLVGNARGKPAADVDKIAQGRVWDGGTARQLGLVDQFGGLGDAVAYAAKKAQLADGQWHVEFLGSSPDSYASLFQQIFGEDDESAPAEARDFVGLVAERQQELARRGIATVQRLLSVQGAQAYCLECPVPVQADERKAQDGFLAAVASWFESRL